MAKPIQQAAEVLNKAQKEINELLKGTEYTNNLVGINQHFDRIRARLGFMVGTIDPDLNKSKKDQKDQFPPITSFMGEKIDVSEKSKTPELRPDEAKRKQFVGKVDRLFDEIEEMNPQTILNSYTSVEDIMVIRGVAKRADIPDFKDAEIDLAFVETIQKAVKIKKENDVTQANIDKNSKSTKVTLTEEMIEKNPELKKRNAQPGDELEEFPDGKFKVHKMQAK